MENNIRDAKVDDAIQRLATVASDISKLVAVMEHRLAQVEKQNDVFSNLMEKRRDDTDQKIDEIYDFIKNEDNRVVISVERINNETLNKIKEIKESQSAQDVRISKIERLILMCMGAAVILGGIGSIVVKILIG